MYEEQVRHISNAVDALPNPAGIPFQNTPYQQGLLVQAAFKGSVELCKMVWDLNSFMPSRALEYAAFGGSIACVQFLLSKQPKLSPAGKANMIHEALRGVRPVEMIGYLLEHARFSLRVWNPVFYKPGEAIPDWAWDLQRRLAARELGYQAAKRALKHAGMHKDLIPMICQMILKSEVKKW
jgi:hypothetical protein